MKPPLNAGLRGLAGVLVCSFLQGGDTVRVTAVRAWSLPDACRVVIETTGEFTFRSDRAPNPERLFFDLVGARPQLGRKGIQTIPVSDRLVKQIRVAETVPGVTRVVFDLGGPVEFKASPLTNPNRLVVELKPAGEGSPPEPVPVEPVLTSSHSAAAQSSLRAFAPPPFAPLPRVRPLPPPILIALAAPAADSSLLAAIRPPVTLAPPPRRIRSRSTVLAAHRATTSPVPSTAPEKTIAGTETVVKAVVTEPVLPKRTPGAFAAKLPRASEGSLTRALGLKIGRIVIDAGHGGHDTGTIGPGGLMEKDLVLDVAQRLGAMIAKRLGSEVVYTRSDDTFIPLEMRTQIANQQHADLFLSIHANSSPANSASGVETYYLNLTSSKEALEVAARENAGSQKTVYDLRDLVQRIALQDKVEESREFAQRVQTSLHAMAVRSNSSSRNRGVKKAPFVVLIGAQMPSVLAEVGFVSNPRDENLMKKGAHRQKMAEALFEGVSKYSATLSHFEVASN